MNTTTEQVALQEIHSAVSQQIYPATSHFSELQPLLNDYIKADLAHYHGQLWLVVDPTVNDPLDNPIFADFFIKAGKNDEKDYHRLNMKHDKILETQTPYLVSLDLNDPNHQALFDASIQVHWVSWRKVGREMGLGQNICGWIISDQSPEVLTQHLGKLALQKNAKGKQFLFRYYDPQVMPGLWQTCNAMQRQQLFANISVWYQINRYHELIAYHNQDPQTSYSTNLNLDNENLVALHLLEANNRFEYLYLKEKNILISKKQAVEIQNGMKICFDLGYQSIDDLILFAQYMMNVHLKFYEHPIIRDDLANPYRQKNLSKILSSDGYNWENIANSLNQYYK